MRFYSYVYDPSENKQINVLYLKIKNKKQKKTLIKEKLKKKYNGQIALE